MSDLNEETRTITLAGVVVDVLPQPPIYLMRRLKRLQDMLGDLGSGGNLNVADLLFGAGGHDVLSMLIPDLPVKIPLHAWMGYASPEAMEADELDETQPPHPPTFPEIRGALTAFKEVNDFDLIERVLGLMDPQMRQDLMWDLTTDLILAIMPNSPSSEDGSEVSTSSTETPPTGTPSDSD